MTQTSSLLQYLTRSNPVVDSSGSLKGSNTTSSSYTWKRPDEVVPWNDFEYSTLQAMYGSILDIDVQADKAPDLAKSLPNHLTEIRDEDSLTALLVRWSNAVVSNALKFTHERPELAKLGHGAEEIAMARGGQAWIPGLGKLKNSKVLPDWAGILRGTSRKAPFGAGGASDGFQNILPGDTKLCTKWKSSFAQTSEEYRKPLSQILTYCHCARVRYGYLITQEELVVVRVSVLETNPRGHRKPQDALKGPFTRSRRKEESKLTLPRKKEPYFRLEYKSIPWMRENANSSPEQMSINLALWWLHLMAARNNSLGRDYRRLSSEYPSHQISSSRDGPGAGASFKVVTKRVRAADTTSDTRKYPPVKKAKKNSQGEWTNPSIPKRAGEIAQTSFETFEGFDDDETFEGFEDEETSALEHLSLQGTTTNASKTRKKGQPKAAPKSSAPRKSKKRARHSSAKQG